MFQSLKHNIDTAKGVGYCSIKSNPTGWSMYNPTKNPITKHSFVAEIIRQDKESQFGFQTGNQTKMKQINSIDPKIALKDAGNDIITLAKCIWDSINLNLLCQVLLCFIFSLGM